MPYFSCPICRCREPQRENEVRCEHLTKMIERWKSGKVGILEAYEDLKSEARELNVLRQNTQT